jgi:hypothetical protein
MTTVKMNVTEFQNKVLSELATIREMLSHASSKKVKKERKPRDPNAKPNDWIVFTGRVREVLKAADLPAGKECQQFASYLKSTHTNAYEMTDEEIQGARSGWEAPPPKPKPVAASDIEASAAEDVVPVPKPKRVLSYEQKAKMAAGRKAAAEKRKAGSEAPPTEPPATALPSQPVEKKLRPLPYKGKKLLWDTETNGTWLSEKDGSKGVWFGRYNKETKTVDQSASE